MTDKNRKKSQLDALAEGRKSFPKKGINLEKYRERSEELKQQIDARHTLQSNSLLRFKTSRMLVAILAVFAILITLSQNLKKQAAQQLAIEYEYFEPKGSLATVPETTLPADIKAVSNSHYVAIPRPFYKQELHDAVQKQKEFSQSSALPLEVENAFGIRLRLIPPGTFMMGSPLTEQYRQAMEDLHENNIPEGFYCGKFEITQQQYLDVIGSNPSEKQNDLTTPVNQIDFYQALNFVEKLNEKLNLPADTYQLLTETQWEYINRAGSTAPFPFGEKRQLLPYYAVRASMTGGQPIGSKLPNAWGLYNTVGNLWEWTRTPFFYYDLPNDKFAYSGNWNIILDKPIYDGDIPMDTINPIDHFETPNRTQGNQNGLFFADENDNGNYTEGEFLWSDSPTGREGIYDHEIDTLIYRGSRLRRDISPFNGIKGLQKDIYFHDADANGIWSNGEDIWQYDLMGRNSSDARMVRGGAWSMKESRYFRSAQRFKLPMAANSDYLSLRIMRKMPKVDNALRHKNVDTLGK